MKPETHLEAFAEHKDAIFRWALEVRGIDKSQRIVGLHASRGITELLSAMLHEKGLLPVSASLNHRWFKTIRVMDRLPPFPGREGLLKKIVELENLSEDLTYGSPKAVETIKKAIGLFMEIEKEVQRQRGDHG
ncbi:MAG: hypothetical protein AABX47_01230 [Nanoarchaeota archaeon]